MILMNNAGRPGNKNKNSKNRLLVHASHLVPVVALLWFASSTSSCSIYRFKDVSIPDSIKTVKINYIENKARYINPQLSSQLSDKLRQKIVNQTRLTQTNDEADWEISGYISDYSVSTAAISNQQNATDRLNISVHITIYDRQANKSQDYDITRSFDYSATQTLEQVQASRSDEIISNLTDEIFNKLFSNW
ncbi:MAG: LptE family protein [Bacteroidota bacterium]